jgi:hypothetical protein
MSNVTRYDIDSHLMVTSDDGEFVSYDDYEKQQECYNAVIEYILGDDNAECFLRCWCEGDFDALRDEWENVPEAVFYAEATGE